MNERYKVEVQADSTGTWAGNGLTFRTIRRAYDYAMDLSGRWTAVRHWRIIDTETGMEAGSSLSLSFIPPRAIEGYKVGDEVKVARGDFQGEVMRVSRVEGGTLWLQVRNRVSGEWEDFSKLDELELAMISRPLNW